ncbi:MAG TPA: ceramidase domain-containing protein [Burkholderiales bacterium]|nr:ceramidase domain-containing protein [Burkholderiales bacterium]
MEQSVRFGPGWREAALILLMLAPLFYLLFLYGAPIPQDRGYHVFADVRTCLGLRNFGNVVSNVPFLLVGAAGALWCYRHPGEGAVRSWMVFFLGVALVFFGSAYYHRTPGDDSLVWDRLPMTIAFMGLFVALVSEHIGQKLERVLLVPAVVAGIASVLWWKLSDDLRVYVWVQFAPLLAIPFVLAAYPARYTHRHYLLYGVAIYALAKVAEYYDYAFFNLTASAVSGHSLKHLLAAAAPFIVYLMLRRRSPVAVRRSPAGTPR